MNPEIQKKIDCIAELIRQRDAIDRELEAMLGVTPIKPVEPAPVQVPAETPEATRAPAHIMRSPSGHTVPRISRLSYDKEAVEADIRAGVLKASTIADKYGIEVSTVYQIKSVMKKEGRLDAPAPAEKPNEVKELSEDTIEQIQDLRDRHKTTTEIANMLALDFEAVAAVPARSRRFRKLHEEEDELPEELAPEEEESEDEDAGEDDYDPLAYRGKVAGSEI